MRTRGGLNTGIQMRNTALSRGPEKARRRAFDLLTKGLRRECLAYGCAFESASDHHLAGRPVNTDFLGSPCPSLQQSASRQNACTSDSISKVFSLLTCGEHGITVQ
jgi:hypothetical protein